MTMKAAGLTLLLLLQCISKSFASKGNTDDYPLCPNTYQTVSILNWYSITRGDTETFSFNLSMPFSNYFSPCSGERSGDSNSGYIPCEVQDENFNAFVDYSRNGYLGLNHTFICDRGDNETDRFAMAIATGDGRLNIGLIDTPEGHYTGTAGDNLTLTVYPEVAHRKPSKACLEASLHSPEWKVQDFKYSSHFIDSAPFSFGGSVANINYDLLNTANDFLINCQAVGDSADMYADDDRLIDPNVDWPCPISYRDDLFPPEAYPKTSFKFDRSRNELSIEQSWECEDENGDGISLSAVGSTALPLNCTSPASDEEPSSSSVDCNPISSTVKASIISQKR
ncbi:hypothetical protein F4779DRAFT_528537 [Xylariaceae sp. FL0662B]|nr:hypothetical protein F4779DRAFT_528537 [Xylariaceae sp. FL0662B]